MTNSIDDALGLPRLSELLQKQSNQEISQQIESLPETIENINKLEKAVSTIESELADHDQEMDELAKIALDDYKKLMDLGFNTEARIAGSIFEPAVNVLRLVMDSKNAKIDKKLRLMRLQLDKERIIKSQSSEDFSKAEEGMIIADRNAILEALKNKDSNK
jgi:hypothetical protein